MKHTYFYDRVSSDDQKKEGVNIKYKKEKMIREGIREEDIYTDEGISGGFNETSEVKIHITPEEFIVHFPIKKRPSFNKLIQKLNKETNTKLVFSKYDRISRSSSFGDLFFIWLEQKGIEWKATEDIDTHESPAMRRFLLAWANDRKDNDASNVQSQRKNMYEQGIFPYKSPYGYIRNKNGELTIDQKKADTILNIFIQISEGHNPKEVAKQYEMNPSSIYTIIRNRCYIGEIHLSGQYKKSPNIPQIITEELYQKANSYLKKRA